MLRLEQRRERLQLGSQGGYVMAIPKLLEAACKGSHASQGTFQEINAGNFAPPMFIRNCDYP